MTGRNPWWYSGDEEAAEPQDGAASAEEPVGASGPDWLSLLTGAQRMVDWATERVMAPHADHADPNDHPQCVICRTLVLLGETPPRPAESQASGADDDDRETFTPIQWIPIRDEALEP